MNEQKSESLAQKLQVTLLKKPDEKRVIDILNKGVLDSLFPEPDPLVDLQKLLSQKIFVQPKTLFWCYNISD